MRRDGTNITGTGITTIDFATAINAPTAGIDTYVIDEDTNLTVDSANGLLANDDDPQGDSISITNARDSAGNLITIGSAHTMPSGGVLTLQADGSFTYVPAAHFGGAEFFNYNVADPAGNTSTAFATINVNPIADIPTLNPSYTTTTYNEDELSPALTLAPSTPDTDGSEVLTVVASGIATGGTLTDGTNTFTASSVNNSIDISSWDLGQIQFMAPQHSDFDQTVTYTVTTTEPNGDSQSVSQVIAYNINAAADAPNLSTTDTGGGVDQPVDLSGLISVSLVDTDGSETLTSSRLPCTCGRTITRQWRTDHLDRWKCLDFSGTTQQPGLPTSGRFHRQLHPSNLSYLRRDESGKWRGGRNGNDWTDRFEHRYRQHRRSGDFP